MKDGLNNNATTHQCTQMWSQHSTSQTDAHFNLIVYAPGNGKTQEADAWEEGKGEWKANGIGHQLCINLNCMFSVTLPYQVITRIPGKSVDYCARKSLPRRYCCCCWWINKHYRHINGKFVETDLHQTLGRVCSNQQTCHHLCNRCATTQYSGNFVPISVIKEIVRSLCLA